VRLAVIAYSSVVERVKPPAPGTAYAVDPASLPSLPADADDAAGATSGAFSVGATSGTFGLPGTPGMLLRTTIDAKKLEFHLDWYATHGFETLTLDELAELSPDPAQSGPKRIALCFDGGHEAHYRLVFPMLQKRRMRATFLVPRDMIDQPGGLTHNEVEILGKWGMGFGVLAPPAAELLRMLPPQVKTHLTDTRVEMERMIGRRITLAATAARHVEAPILRTFHAHDFRSVAISEVANHGIRDGMFVIGRYFYRKSVNPDDWKNVAKLSVTGPAKAFFQVRPT
jgi:peptidoglycan/xylan/chitin deacetylase (PgdA/CDA1 family)